MAYTEGQLRRHVETVLHTSDIPDLTAATVLAETRLVTLSEHMRGDVFSIAEAYQDIQETGTIQPEERE